MRSLRNVLAQYTCVSRDHPTAPSQEQGRHQAGWDVLCEQSPCPAVEGEVVSSTPSPLILLSQPWHPVNGAGCGPATPSPQPGDSSSGTPAPHPNYCWVSQKTLKGKEESCEEGHFSGSFSLLFFFPPPRRKLEKQSPQSRIERVTETG